MPLHGDINGLKKLADRIREVKSEGFKTELSQLLGAAALKLVADGFRGSHDPYGNPWLPLKTRKGKPLEKTGRMKGSASVDPRSNGFKLTIATVYAPVHQRGGHVAPHSRIRPQIQWHNPKTGRLVARTTRLKLVVESRIGRRTFGKGITIPQRRMVPDQEGGGLGPIWTAAFRKEAESLLRRRLQGAA